MSAFYFVGSHCEIDGGRIKLTQFGQRIELTDEVAETVVRGGGAILPEEKFRAIGFSDEELKKYAHPGPRENAPADFKARHREALVAFHEYKQDAEAAFEARISDGGQKDEVSE